MTGPLRKVGRFIFGRLLPRRPYPVLLGPLKGYKVVLGALAGEGGGASVYFGGVERAQTTTVCRHLQRAQRFFDIGANAGYYTLLASRIVTDVGEVVSVEPLESNLSMLRRHIEINRLRNVTVIPAAVADEIGTERFSEGDSNATGCLDSAGDFEVAVLTLDEITRRQGRPDMIKIDVEGAEERVLAGAPETLSMKPKLLLSTHSVTLRSRCLDTLAGYGYICSPVEQIDEPHEFFCE